MLPILAHGSRGRQISLSQNKTQQQQQQQLAKAKMDLRKDNIQWPTGVCKRAPRHPLTIGKHKPDP